MKTASSHANKILAAAIGAVLSSSALAQTTASALEEVIITAERREISLQETPTSATVLTAETLASQGVDNIIDIQQVAPSVAINTYNRGTFVNIRGVGIAQSAPTSNPGVAYYIDGVYIPHETFISQSFYDIESIEVLRGPQGTLTGQNSTGGAVYVRTPNPKMGEFSGYLDQTLGEYQWFRSVGAVNIPFGEMIAVRIAGIYEKRDSFSENIGTSPSEPGSINFMRGVRAAVRIQPTDGMTFDLRYEHFDYSTDYNAVKRRDDTVSSDPFVIQEDALSFLNQDGYRASAEARVDLGATMELRVLTSLMKGDNYDQADGDRRSGFPAGPGQGGRVGYTAQSFDTKVTEINLLSKGEDNLQWVAGAFYLNETTPVAVLRDNTNTFTYTFPSSRIEAEAENTSASLFGQVDYRLTDMFAIDLGVRYSDDQQDYTRFALPGPNPGGNFNCFPCTTTAESAETTGRLGGKMYVGEETMYYLTFSRGYKAGGVNLDPRLGNFGPETNNVAELGIKTTIADSRLRINGNVFYSDYDGIQLSALTSVGPGPALPNTLNASSGEIYGVELELTGRFGEFGFNFGGSWLNGEFAEDTLLTDGSVIPSVDKPVLKGTRLPFTPEYMLSGGIEYNLYLHEEIVFTPRLQASYIGEQYATPFQNVNTRVPSRTVTDFRVTMKFGDAIRIEGFANNMFDKEYIAVQVQEASSASGGMIYGAPRQFGMRVKYAF